MFWELFVVLPVSVQVSVSILMDQYPVPVKVTSVMKRRDVQLSTSLLLVIITPLELPVVVPLTASSPLRT